MRIVGVGRKLTDAGAEVLRRVVISAVGMEHRRFLEATHDPRRWQLMKLKAILASNAETEYGRKYGFSRALSLGGFQRTVPIVSYDDIRPYVDRMMDGQRDLLTSEAPYQYLLTSGSSSKPKYIPVTKEFRKEYACRLQFYYLYRQHPEVFRPGAVLSVVSPAVEGRTVAGVPYGAASGLTYITQNPLVKTVYAVPYTVFTITNFEAKYYAVLRFAIECDLRLIVMANPSSILLLASEMNRHADELIDDVARGSINSNFDIDPSVRATLAARLRPNLSRARELARIRSDGGGLLPPTCVWPNLRAVVCWRDASAALYLPELTRAFPNVAAYNLGYAASEGLGTFRLADYGVEVLAITGHFFEFCEESRIEACLGRPEELLLCDELEEGKRYFIVMTTSGGLYRYHIDDIVEVQGFVNRTPVLRFLQKGVNTWSFTGEKLTEAQVIEGVKGVTLAHGLATLYFCAVPVFEQTPYYRVYMETTDVVVGERADALAAEIDAAFCRLNVEFETKRASHRLAPTRLCALPAGFFEYYSRAAHGAMRAAQIKFKHLNPDSLFHESLSSFGIPAKTAGQGPKCG